MSAAVIARIGPPLEKALDTKQPSQKKKLPGVLEAIVKALEPMLSKGATERLVVELAKQQRAKRMPHAMTISKLCKLYIKHAKDYYRPFENQRTTEFVTVQHALRPLKKLFNRLPVANFGPLKLKAVREEMIAKDWCRKSVNDQMSRIKRMFKWGVENEVIPPEVFHGLQAVGLRYGRSAARESDPVKPAPEHLIESVLPRVSSQVAAVIRLQLLTGMRPGEALTIRTCDVDMSEQPWRYSPMHHKTAHHGHQRAIFLGPKSQQVIKPFLKLDTPTKFIFSPKDAEQERRRCLHAERKTPLSCGNVPGSNRKRSPQHTVGDRYDTCAYARAVARACELAFPTPDGLTPEKAKEWRIEHHWHPHQLRHNAATKLRKLFGIDIAQVVLGHKTLAVTEVYAERDVEKAQKTMLEIG